MALGAYYDESARQDANDPLAVAGYVFKPTAYRQFCRRWRDVLRMAGRPKFLHMTDLYAGKRAPYDGIGNADRRAEVYAAALGVINQYITAGIAIAFYQDEYERIVSADWPQQFGSNYTFASQICLQLTETWMDERRVFDPVVYTFERGNKYRNEVDLILHKVASTPAYKKRFRYRTHAFLEKEEAAGLQAADVLAWSSTKKLAMFAGKAMPKPFETVLKSLGKNDPRYTAKLLDGQNLREHLDGLKAMSPPVQIDVGPRKKGFR